MDTKQKQLAVGDKIEYHGKNIGVVKTFASRYVLKWNQEPIREFSDSDKEVYGMSSGVKKLLEDSKIDYVEIGEGTLPVKTIDSCEKLSRYDDFFKNPPQEDQYLIKIRK